MASPGQPTASTPLPSYDLSALLPLTAERQDLTLLRIYAFYRVMLALLMILVMVGFQPDQIVGSRDINLYRAAAQAYFVVNCAALIWVRRSTYQINTGGLFLLFFIDIFAITTMADASSGIVSGLPTLLLVPIAASAMLLTATIATLVAAMSALATLSDTLRLVNIQLIDLNSFVPAGLLGSLFFATSLFVQFLSRRMRAAQTLAHQRSQALFDLQRLNEQVVQHMQTGVMLVGDNNRVRLLNPAAEMLLRKDADHNLMPGMALEDYSEELMRQYALWIKNPGLAPQAFRAHEGSTLLLANFAHLRGSGQDDSLVFLENYSQLLAQAQQLKLASLGRLTASIAHEIRNPLSAASHATQLLGESSELAEQDLRLAEIVRNHVKRINGIIENVLQISRREAPTPQGINLTEWIAAFMRDYLSAVPNADGVAVHCDSDLPQIRFDDTHLHQVLTNLLNNAIRHANTEGNGPHVQLRCQLDSTPGYCILQVIDDGAGIQTADEAKIFEPFYTTAQQGSGLGLYISKDLCEINGATLEYRRGHNDHSYFTMRVPTLKATTNSKMASST